MWGAVGCGLATLTSGIVYDNTGGGYESVVVVFVAVLAVALVAALRVPVGATDKPTGGEIEGENRCDKSQRGAECWRGTIKPVFDVLSQP